MPTSASPLSRRRLLVSAAAGAAALTAPRAASTQAPAAPGAQQGEIAPDGFRVLRATAGATLGPLLRVRRGEQVKVRLRNEQAAPTALHWHGVRLRNAMDGVPGLTQPPVAPGESFEYRFTPPDAGTFWYRAAAGRGIFGMLVVAESEPVEIDREAVLILQDADTAPLDIAIRRHERLRLRLLNAAAARFFALRLDRHRPMVLAIDGQPAEPFAARDGRVLLGPGNRMDLCVDGLLDPGASAAVLAEGAAEPATVARFVYGADAARPAPLPSPKKLPPNPLPERMDFRGALRLDLAVTATAAGALPALPLFAVRRGRTVMLNCQNRTPEPQVVHLHGHSFRLLDRLDDGWKPFWLDTLPIEPGGSARIAFVADNPGKWLIEAHGRAPGLATWFEVT